MSEYVAIWGINNRTVLPTTALRPESSQQRAGWNELQLLTQQHCHTAQGSAGLKQAAFRSPADCTRGVGC